MDVALEQLRQQLLDRHDAAAKRWPDRSGSDFQRELTAVATGLEHIARLAAARQADPLDVGKTWQWAGMAWYDMAGTRQRPILDRAMDAYRRAEPCLEEAGDPLALVKLDYCIGRALLNLGDDPDASFAYEAAERLRRAVNTARRVAPDLVQHMDGDLRNAEQVAMLRRQTSSIEERIDSLAGLLADRDATSADANPVDVRAAFVLLTNVFNDAKANGSLTRERERSLSEIMSDLADLVDRGDKQDRSLADVMLDRQRLLELKRQMSPLLRRNTPP
jgi:hypothetical protein